MVSFTGYILPLAAICSLVTALPQPPKNGHGNKNAYPTTDQYPLPNVGNVAAHDPNLLEHKESFYMFKGGVHIPIYKSTDLNGPWKQIGTVLPGDSVIKGYGNATRPWAPTTVEWKGKFYCFYSLSGAGDQHSAIGVASTSDIEKGHWKDHGKLMTTNDTNQGTPFNETNAIDPSFIVDKKTGTPYLNYGSYWKNIWQIPLEDDLLSLKNTTVGGVHPKKQSPSSSSSIIHHTSSTQHATPQPTPNAHVKVNASVHVGPKPDKRDNKKNNKGHNKGSDKDDKEDPHKGGKNGKDEVKNNNQGDKNARKVENKAAVQLTFMPNRKQRPEEGSWISHHDGYYYLWFSQGKCCDFKKDGLPPKGAEYHIRVGRSKNISGPYKDKKGKELLKNGGTTVYASNHGTVYAPGGLGVLPGTKNRPDVLYYHYLNTTIGLEHKQAQLGWNYIEYKDGWPVARKNKKGDSSKAT